MSPRPTARAVIQLVRPLRGMNALAWAGIVVGVAALILGVLGWFARLGWLGAPWWVFLAWGLVTVSVGLLAVLARRQAATITSEWAATRLEELGAWREGAISALLDAPAPGTSTSLLEAADQACASEVKDHGAQALRPISSRLRHRVAGAGAFCAVGLAAFITARPLHGPTSQLWHPADAWEAARGPLSIVPGASEIDRGQSVSLGLKATGRRQATLWLRGPGEAWQPRELPLDSLGRRTEIVGPLRTDLFARLTSGGRSSDTIEVRVRIPAFLGSLTVTAHYPRYLEMEDEPVPVSGDTLMLPVGTSLETVGAATADLASGAWVWGSGQADLRINGAQFTGRFTPTRSEGYHLNLRTRSGDPLAGDSVTLPVRVIPDSAPTVNIPVPGADTIAPLSLRLPLVIEAQDDYGVTAVEVESHRISRLGFVDPPKREPVALPMGKTDHLVLNFDFDLNSRGLLPGDTVRYLVRARDNSPEGHVGTSREYVLRLPTLSEVRAAARQASQDVAHQLDSLTAESSKLERSTEDISRERERPTTGQKRGDSAETMSYESAKRAQAVAQSQQEMIQRAEALKSAVEELQRSAEAAGLNDPAWQQRLKEIQDQLERALTPELRERLAELQRALTDLDPQQAKEALQQLAEAQKQLRDALERSRELFQRAAIEGDMANLAAESRELAQEQQRWAEQSNRADSNRAAAEEKDLTARADSLAAQLKRLAPQMDQPARQASIDSAGAQAGQASQEMLQASQAAEQGQRQQARQRGEQAARMLSPLGQLLQQQRNAMERQWREEVTAAMDRAMAETSRITEGQLSLSERLQRGDASASTRGEQGALEEGVEKLLEQMQAASGKNALVSPQIGVSLSAAQQQMQHAREAIASGAPNTREAADAAGQAVDALNTAAYQLSRSRGQVSNAQSGSGLQEAMEQMQRLAAQQGGMNQDASGMLPMLGNSGIQEQLRQLGARQRAMADELERMRAQGNSPGAADMAQEARDLARRLEAGRLDRQTVERQEQLFRRMLDAGRTLQGQQEDQNKERQSTTASGDSSHLPPALRTKLMGEDNRIHMPDWESLQRLSPEERRLVMEYFQRLAGPGE